MNRAVGWLIGAYLFVLWGELLLWDTEGWRGHPSDVVLAAALAAAAPALWRGRALLVGAIPLLTAALALSLIASTLVAGDGVPINIAGRLGVQLTLVALGAAIWGGPLAEARPIVERAAVTVALASTAVTLVGGALGAAGLLDGLEQWMWKPAFVDRTGHPTLGDWPRLVGGFSFSAETCGLWSAASAAVLLAAGRRTWMLAAVAAVATLSIGGAAIVALAPFAVRRHRGLAAAAAVIATLALQWPVHRAGADCDAWPNHRVRREDGTCTTRYALAKEHAVELVRADPVLGVGALGFRRHAAAHATNPYYTTHGAWHGIAAEQGLVGLGLALALAAILARRARHAPMVVAALLAIFLAASLDLDVHRHRLLWLVIGYATAIQRDDPRRQRRQ